MANKNWIIGLVVLLVLVSFGTFYAVTEFSVIGGDETGEQVLTECSNVPECINFLNTMGMPDGLLEDNGISIECEDGVCYAIK